MSARAALPASFLVRASPAALPELMDDPAVDAATLAACLASLASVNRLSLGHRPTLEFVDRVAQRVAHRPLRILDIGSGYGDSLRVVAARLAARGVPAELVGIDLNPRAVAIATAATDPALPIRFEVGDAREAGGTFDALLASLVAHHLEDDEVVGLLRLMDRAPAFLVNDLHRSRLAAVGFGALAAVTARHKFVRHDGPVSFARAFRRPDWERLLAAAGVSARIFLGAPFRLCVEKLP